MTDFQFLNCKCPKILLQNAATFYFFDFDNRQAMPVMNFLPFHCELSIFVTVTVIFLGEKCGEENFICIFIFFF
jgi:hypothetical protein